MASSNCASSFSAGFGIGSIISLERIKKSDQPIVGKLHRNPKWVGGSWLRGPKLDFPGEGRLNEGR